jgi:membrane fusion protein (multidrug efflux system)
MEVALPAGVGVAQGSFARVSVVMKKKDNAVVIPVDAIVQKAGGKSMVFVVEKGIAHARPIEKGIESGGRVEVISGVSPGEALVVRGQEMLKDGAQVKVKPQKKSPGQAEPGPPGTQGLKKGPKGGAR